MFSKNKIKEKKQELQEVRERYIRDARALVNSIPDGAENKAWEIDNSKHLERGIVFAPTKEIAKAKYILSLVEGEDPYAYESITNTVVEEIDTSVDDIWIYYTRY